jgi:hypothetical protein
MTSQEKCVTHVQATLPRLRELTFGCNCIVWRKLDRVGYKTNAIIPHISAEGILGWQDWTNEFFSSDKYELEIIGHTPTLGDWLELLSNGLWRRDVQFNNKELKVFITHNKKYVITFNLATNEPSTEKDWDTLAELLNL